MNLLGLARWTPLLPCLFGVFAGCGGCKKGTEPASLHEDTRVTAAPERQAPTPPESQWSSLLGEEDSESRYSATSMVIVHDAADAAYHKECSGVLVAPRLVLTAAHCVCQHREALADDAGALLTDTSLCAATATVVMVTSEPPTPDGVAEAWSVNLSGSVRPHPQFRLLTDSLGNVVSSRANLALIFLDQPVKAHIPPVRLATENAKIGESLTIVGFGYADGPGALDGRRRFSREPVTGSVDPDGERMLFGRPELYAYQGDTGGPCLREGPGDPTLVGISTRGLGRAPAFTSISPYREWLHTEIQLATQAGTEEHPAPTPEGAPKP